MSPVENGGTEQNSEYLPDPENRIEVYLACGANRAISRIPQCITQISHNAPFYKMVHCGIYDWCIVEFVPPSYMIHV